MLWLRRIALAILGRYGASLRFPHLLLITGALFALDLIVPDMVPFLDEIGLGLVTLMFAAWRRPKGEVDAAAGEDVSKNATGPSG